MRCRSGVLLLSKGFTNFEEIIRRQILSFNWLQEDDRTSSFEGKNNLLIYPNIVLIICLKLKHLGGNTPIRNSLNGKLATNGLFATRQHGTQPGDQWHQPVGALSHCSLTARGTRPPRCALSVLAPSCRLVMLKLWSFHYRCENPHWPPV